MLLLPIGLLTSAVPSAAPLLLDAIGVAVRGAYGSRKLRAAYAGDCLRMRRASDNAELDLGFAADGSMDSAAILAFGGATGSVYVTKWYDQSAAVQDMSQTVAAQQPNLLLNGVAARLQNATSRPSPLFNVPLTTSLFNNAFSFGAASDKVSVSAVGMNNASTQNYARLACFTATGQTEDYDSPGSACLILACAGNTTLGSYRHVLLANIPLTKNEPFQAVSSFDGTNHIITVNGTASAPSSSTGLFAADGRMIFGMKVPGLNQGDQAWDGYISEVIIATGPLSTGDQATIRTSQQTYYGTP